tara:strand:+ start:176 stop:376 length:201 start_codon:yes stop_codon:yes gene_type:complete
MGNMSYCRFENTARDLRDCVEAIHNGETEELNEYELSGLLEILNLANTIIGDQNFIMEILEEYENN